MKAELGIVIADDHPIFRRGLCQIVESDTGLRVIGEAGNGREALDLIEQLRPQVAVVDVNMPEMNGFDLVRETERRKLGVGIIFLTMHDDEDMFNRAFDLGAKGYVLKDSAIAEIINAVRVVAAGQPFISPQLSRYLLNRANRASRLVREMPGLSELTPAERRILKMIAEYKTSKEIAEELHIHYRTVDNHRTNIAQKLGVRGGHALLKFAVEHRSEI